MSPSPDPVDVHVGQVMRARRLVLGQSQSDLAAALGLSFQQVQKYERGANRVSASMLHHAARAQGVPTAYYFEGLGDGEWVAEGEDAVLARAWLSSREAWAFAVVASKLSQPARNALLQFVRDLVARPDKA